MTQARYHGTCDWTHRPGILDGKEEGHASQAENHEACRDTKVRHGVVTTSCRNIGESIKSHTDLSEGVGWW
jgi:hypothetical protein